MSGSACHILFPAGIEWDVELGEAPEKSSKLVDYWSNIYTN